MRPVLYLAITSHGFGHVVRVASVAAQVQKLLPDVLLIFVTTAPHWLIRSYVKGDFIQRPKRLDVGVIQADSFSMDYSATLEKLREIRRRSPRIIAGEVDFLRLNRAQLVLADLPPLAIPIAHGADIPCWCMGNFGWDFIYRAWGGEFIPEADWITELYREGDRLFRLPLHEPMGNFANVTNVGLTGGDPQYDLAALRERFQLTHPKEKTILLSFGGLGFAGMPYEALAQFPDYQFISFDRNAPDLANLRKITETQYRPVDFMPLCDRIISKPGFSTYAEALRLDLPVVTLPRDDFAEGPILIKNLQQYGHHQILDPEQFAQGDWDFLRESPQPPQGNQPIDKTGIKAIAQAIAEFLSH
ncbi:glycosyl transferase [Picosynechococcus sp. PCC 7117]|uniref:glycosyl transferase n=1 Tax=Picosynechococcus sp. PCC 7117 TaxID=195498 RepID=UPI000810466B|nr:glycosyl transferase [Picosynechococcus sp. PCC 7117]ANV86625.1 glycosyl transferase [Picosynechococcus sp. PCC 7117]